MGLWEPALYHAIAARLLGDNTGTGNLCSLLASTTGSIKASFPQPAVDPRGSTYPCVTFACVDESIPDEPFDGRYMEHLLELRIYVEEQPSDGSESLLTLSKIKARVLGNWPEKNSSTPPDYGLDRWQPDFTGYTGDSSTSYSANHIVFDSGYDATDPGAGIREWVYRFKCRMFLHRS